jgi:hypothetical protein
VPDLPLAGPPPEITLSDIQLQASTTFPKLTYQLSQNIDISCRWNTLDTNAPSVAASGTALDNAGTVGQRSMTLNVGSGKEGLTIWYELYCASIPAGKIFRPLQGTFRMPKSRTSVAGRSVPVRWNTFGDGTRPVDGGGTGALKNGPNAGNWSSYTWAQYNPKGTTFPTP